MTNVEYQVTKKQIASFQLAISDARIRLLKADDPNEMKIVALEIESMSVIVVELTREVTDYESALLKKAN